MQSATLISDVSPDSAEVTAEQAFWSLEKPARAPDLVASSAGLAPQIVDRLRERLTLPAFGGMVEYGLFHAAPDQMAWVQILGLPSAGERRTAHVLVTSGRPAPANPFDLLLNPGWFLTRCPYIESAPTRPIPETGPAEDEVAALKSLQSCRDVDRLAHLIEAAMAASSEAPLMFTPAWHGQALAWFQALFLCLPPYARTDFTCSTWDTPAVRWRATSPAPEAAWPTAADPPGSYARGLAALIVQGDLQSVLLLAAGVAAPDQLSTAGQMAEELTRHQNPSHRVLLDMIKRPKV